MNWSEFVTYWRPRIVHYIAVIRGRPDLAEEVAHRVLLQILTAQYTSRIGFVAIDKTRVAPKDELTLLLDADSHLVQLRQNNLVGLCEQIRALNVGVSASIKTKKEKYHLRLSVPRDAAGIVELRTEPGDPASNILDTPKPPSVLLVARHRLIDIYRQLNREIPLEEPRDDEEDKPGTQYSDPRSAERTNAFENDRVLGGFDCLAEQDRLILWFYIVEELTLEEIGEIVGWDHVSTVRSRIKRALERLRLQLQIPHELIIAVATQRPALLAEAETRLKDLNAGDSVKIYAIRDGAASSDPLAIGTVPKDNDELHLGLKQAFNGQPKRTTPDFLAVLGQVRAKECKTTIVLFAEDPLQVADPEYLERQYRWHAKKLDGTEVHVYLPPGVAGDSYKIVIKGFGGQYIRK